MRKLFLLLLFVSGFAFGQKMPNIAKVWLNNNYYYTGTISKENIPMKVKIVISEQDKRNNEEYFISGLSIVDKTLVNFEGKIKISQYKDGKKKSNVYGEYEFAEEKKGKHSGIFTGKFIYTFQWNKKKQVIENQYIQFIGDWKSYDGTMIHRTDWKNQ